MILLNSHIIILLALFSIIFTIVIFLVSLAIVYIKSRKIEHGPANFKKWTTRLAIGGVFIFFCSMIVMLYISKVNIKRIFKDLHSCQVLVVSNIVSNNTAKIHSSEIKEICDKKELKKISNEFLGKRYKLVGIAKSTNSNNEYMSFFLFKKHEDTVVMEQFLIRENGILEFLKKGFIWCYQSSDTKIKENLIQIIATMGRVTTDLDIENFDIEDVNYENHFLHILKKKYSGIDQITIKRIE